jgi:hypothetical protein
MAECEGSAAVVHMEAIDAHRWSLALWACGFAKSQTRSRAEPKHLSGGRCPVGEVEAVFTADADTPVTATRITAEIRCRSVS